MRFLAHGILFSLCFSLVAGGCSRPDPVVKVNRPSSLPDGSMGQGAASERAGGANSNVGSALPFASLTCDPSRSSQKNSESRMLWREAIGNSVTDVLGLPTEAFESELRDYPSRVVPKFPYRTTSPNLDAVFVEKSLRLGGAIGEAAAARPDIMLRHFPCARSVAELETASASCLTEGMRAIATAAFRRQVTALESAGIEALLAVGESNDGLAKFASAVSFVFSHPSFLFLPALNTADAASPEFGARIAERMALMLWQSVPDEALRRAAASGSLATSRGRLTEARRMLQNAKARRSLRSFYTDWLGLERMPTLAFDPDSGRTPESPELTRQEVREEILSFVLGITLDDAGTVRDLMTSPKHFGLSPRLEELYYAGKNRDGLNSDSLDPSQRAGIPTRLGFLLDGGQSVSAIARGVKATKLLCVEHAPPPPNAEVEAKDALASAPPLSGSRQIAERITSPAACVGCHTWINGPGFALGEFDGLGRFIASEKVYKHGDFVGAIPVNASADVGVAEEGTLVSLKGGVALSRWIGEHPRLPICYAREYFRHSSGNLEAAGDGCAIREFASHLKDKPVAEALLHFIASEHFLKL